MDYILYSLHSGDSNFPDVITSNDSSNQCFDCFLDSLPKQIRDYISHHGDVEFHFHLQIYRK